MDDVEAAISEVKSQILNLKKSSISAESIYGFLMHFNDIYQASTDAEKKKFMQFFIERIELSLSGEKMETGSRISFSISLCR